MIWRAIIRPDSLSLSNDPSMMQESCDATSSADREALCVEEWTWETYRMAEQRARAQRAQSVPAELDRVRSVVPAEGEANAIEEARAMEVVHAEGQANAIVAPQGSGAIQEARAAHVVHAEGQANAIVAPHGPGTHMTYLS